MTNTKKINVFQMKKDPRSQLDTSEYFYSY